MLVVAFLWVLERKGIQYYSPSMFSSRPQILACSCNVFLYYHIWVMKQMEHETPKFWHVLVMYPVMACIGY